MNTVKWGIAGPGRQAAVLAADFEHVPGAELVAVGSRSQSRAQAFADAHGVARAHASYADLMRDPEVDVIYIATPHPQHRDLALAAIAEGKAVLVEKAFAATLEGAEAIAYAARTKGVFAMEAMWTKFLPAIAKARELVRAGEIGEVRGVQGDLIAFREYVPTDRLFDPLLGGGAVLDLGVYAVGFAQHFLGQPDVVHSVGGHFPNGVESEVGILLGYDDGRSASLSIGFTCRGPGRMALFGTKGWIDVHPRFHHPNSITVHRAGAEPELLTLNPLGAGYAHELIEVTQRIAAGHTESEINPLDDTIAVQQTMATVLDQMGLHPKDDDLAV